MRRVKSGRRASLWVEMLEARRLLAAPSLACTGTTDSSVSLSYTADANASLMLEIKSDADLNFHSVAYPIVVSQVGQTYTVGGLRPETAYSFRLRSILDGELEYGSTSASTQEWESTPPGDLTLSPPTLVLTPETAGSYEIRDSGPAYLFTVRFRWEDRPDFLGGPGWGAVSDLNGQINGAPAHSNQTVDFKVPYIPDLRFPLSYVRSTEGNESRIMAFPMVSFPIASAQIWIRGGGSGFTYRGQVMMSNTAAISATEALPDTIDDSAVMVNWEISTNEGRSYFSLGSSANHLYVTGVGVSGASETVLDLGCRGAKGNKPESNEEMRSITDGIWGEFSGRNTKRVDGTTMKYNHENGSGSSAAEMLADATGRGRCTSWADLLVQTLAAQGVGATSVQMQPKAEYNYLEVRPSAAQGSGGMDYSGNIFNFHQVVQVSVYSHRIYDPSYGGQPAEDAADGKLAYEDAHVVRYWQELTVWNPNKMTWEWVLCNPVDDTVGVKELQW